MARILTREEQYEHMTTTPIPRLVTSLAIPTTINMLVTVIYNTADTYFVSQIDKSASAAVGMVYTLMALIQATGFALGVGSGSLISRKLGEKNGDAADTYASSAFFTALAVGAAVGWGCLAALTPLLRALRCTDTMMPYAVSYAKYILLAAPISCASFVLNNTLRAEGEARVAMWALGAGNILNLFLDPFLIFRLGMGAGGAALATAISQCVSFVLLFAVFLAGKSIVRIDIRLVSRSARDYRLIVTNGLPTLCRQGLGSLASAVLNIQAVAYGDAAVSAVTIANKVYIFARNLVIGIGQGFQPVAGYNYSAGHRRRAWRAFTFSSLVGTVICVLAAAFIAAFREPLMGWFSHSDEVVKIGAEMLSFFAAVLPFLAVSTYVNQLYQCLGYRAAATFLASCRQGIFFLPAVLLLPLRFGCAGVEMSQAVADFITFLVSMPFLLAFYRRHIAAPEAKRSGGQNN